jgi:phosphoglycerate dehydrogenase-like enzyme
MLNFREPDLTSRQWATLRAIADDVVLVSRDARDFHERLASADGVVVKIGMPADAELMAQAPNLRYVGVSGTSFAGVDLVEARRRGIVVTNVRGYAAQSVAEFTLAAAIAVLRDLPNQLAEAGRLGYAEPTTLGRTLAGRRVGVIGLGAIGRRTAELMLAVGADVAYYSRSRCAEAEASGIAFLPLGELLSSASLITLHVPATPAPLLTANLVGAIGDGTILLNMAPNEVVDLVEIERRLARGTLHYVYDHADELPPEDRRRLATYETCWAYPPLGYATNEADDVKRQALVDNILAFVHGSPTNVVSEP